MKSKLELWRYKLQFFSFYALVESNIDPVEITLGTFRNNLGPGQTPYFTLAESNANEKNRRH